MAKYTASDDGKVVDGKIVVWLWPPRSREATAQQTQQPAQPVAPGAAVRTADGTALSGARLENPDNLERGGTVWIEARAASPEGSQVQLVLERKNVPVGKAVATVRSGVVRAAVNCEGSGKEPNPPEKKPGLPAAASAILSHARFDDPRDLQGGGPVWLLARAAGLEGRCVQVVLEREGKPGEWAAVGQATATVRSGVVRAAVTPDPGSVPAPSR